MKRFALVMAVLLMPLRASAADVEITMHSTAVARHPYMTFGEIASISSDSQAAAEKIAALRIQLHGRPGDVVRVSRKKAAAVLAVSGSEDRVTWRGPAFVDVQVVSQTVTTQMMSTAARVYLAEQSDEAGNRVMKLAGEPDAVQIPPGRVNLVVRRPYSEWRARTRLEVEIWVDGIRAASVPVWVVVQNPGAALAAARRVSKEEALTPESVRVVDVDLLSVKGKPLTSVEQLRHVRLRRSISEGEVICEADVERRPPVTRGQPVRGQLNEPGITLEVSGVAAEDGWFGERIRVERAGDSSVWFYGNVTGEGMVTVYE